MIWFCRTWDPLCEVGVLIGGLLRTVFLADYFVIRFQREIIESAWGCRVDPAVIHS